MSDQVQFEKAVNAIRRGNAEEGRNLLIGLLKANPKNELAWLWLARSLPDDTQRIAALEQCIKVNPESETARRTLDQLKARRSPSQPIPDTPQVSKPISGPLPGRTAVAPEQPVPKPTPLSDRIARRSRDTGSSDASAGSVPLAQSTPAQPEPLVYEPVKIIRRYTAAPARPKRARSRLRLSLELLLGLLLLAAAGFLVWAFYKNINTPKLDIAHQGLLATASELENEIAVLRLQVSQRQTRTAAAPTSTRTPDVSPTPTGQVPELTPSPSSIDNLEGVISPQNAASLVVIKEIPGSFSFDLEYSLDGAWLAGASNEGVTVWDADSLELVKQIDLEDRAESLAFSPGGSILAFTQSANEGNASYLFSASTVDWSKLLAGVPFPNGTIALHFTQENRLVLVSYANDNNINLVDPANGLLLAALDHPGGVLAVALDPRTGFLASGGYDDQIRVWDLTAKLSVATLTSHAADVTALAFAPDGRFLASASADGALLLWDPNSWQTASVLAGHPGGVVQLGFSPDGLLLASCGVDGKVMLWDVATGEAVTTLAAPEGAEDLAFSTDGRRLAVAGEQAVMVFALPTP